VTKMFIAAGLAAAAGWGVRWLLPEVHPILLAICVFLPFGAVYFGSAAALRLEEISGVATRARNLLRR
jgi:hypothetical protein